MAAAIALFVFARPDHTRRTIDALKLNTLAKISDLIIYSDAARNEEEQRNVEAVRELVRHTSGFRSVRVIERAENYGLSRNIIDGVNATCSEYERVIVLEDDVLTGPRFLSFMNEALEKYESESSVWHLSGWTYPIETDRLGDAFFWRVMNCWGWATWADRWKHFRKEPARLVGTWNAAAIDRFNVDGTYDFWSQVEANLSGRMDTWAIFWYATIFENGGLCLSASVPHVTNIGQDGSGVNCGAARPGSQPPLSTRCPNLPTNVLESELAIARLREYFVRSGNITLFSRIRRAWQRISGRVTAA
jgi:hypothetical protein